jgi:hypothetical protein
VKEWWSNGGIAGRSVWLIIPSLRYSITPLIVVDDPGILAAAALGRIHD